MDSENSNNMYDYVQYVTIWFTMSLRVKKNYWIIGIVLMIITQLTSKRLISYKNKIVMYLKNSLMIIRVILASIESVLVYTTIQL